MKQISTYRQESPAMGGYPCAADADYGRGTGVFKIKP
jgi:hypothetical protein